MEVDGGGSEGWLVEGGLREWGRELLVVDGEEQEGNGDVDVPEVDTGTVDAT